MVLEVELLELLWLPWASATSTAPRKMREPAVSLSVLAAPGSACGGVGGEGGGAVVWAPAKPAETTSAAIVRETVFIFRYLVCIIIPASLARIGIRSSISRTPLVSLTTFERLQAIPPGLRARYIRRLARSIGAARG